MSFVSKLKPIQVAGIVLSLAAAYYYFSLEEEDKSVVKNGVVKGESKSPALEKTDVQQKTDLGVPKAGEGTELLEDYGKGLWMLAKRIDETGYGAGYVDMYGTPIYLLTDAEMIRKTLSHTVQHALWGGLDAASKAFFGKNVLFVLEGKQWKFLRSVIKHSFSKQDVTLMDMDLAKMAHRFADRIAPNQEVDMNRIFGLYHLSSVGKSAFDFDLDCLSDSNLGPTTVSDSFEFFIDELPRRSLNPDQSVLGDYTIDNEDNRKWNGAARLLRETIYKVIDARLEEYEIDFHKKSVITVDVGGKAHKKGARKDLLDGMIFSTIEAFDAERNGSEGEVDFGNSDHKKVKVDKQFMDDVIESITDNLVEIMFAGYNTNVGTMANCLHFLALYPDVMKKCQAEVDRFFANNSLGKDFDFEDFSKCYKIEKFPNLNNVFNETLRLRPPAPLIARLLTKDYEGTAPNGKTVRLKSGNALWVPVEYVQQSKDNWYEHDPDKFIPDRFNLKKPFKSGSFIPFSFGPRDCIGKNFAAQEAVLGLIFLIRKFNFEVGKGYVYENFFNGFGYRPYDGSTKKVCSRLIPKTRKQVATPAVH